MLLSEIIDHRTDANAISKEEGYFTTKSGKKWMKMTKKGWELCVVWKDGSTDRVALKDLKNSYPVELAQYVIDNKIQDELAFA